MRNVEITGPFYFPLSPLMDNNDDDLGPPIYDTAHHPEEDLHDFTGPAVLDFFGAGVSVYRVACKLCGTEALFTQRARQTTLRRPPGKRCPAPGERGW